MLLFYIGHYLHNSVLTGVAAAVSIGFIVWGGIRNFAALSARHKKGPGRTGACSG